MVVWLQEPGVLQGREEHDGLWMLLVAEIEDDGLWMLLTAELRDALLSWESEQGWLCITSVHLLWHSLGWELSNSGPMSPTCLLVSFDSAVLLAQPVCCWTVCVIHSSSSFSLGCNRHFSSTFTGSPSRPTLQSTLLSLAAQTALQLLSKTSQHFDSACCWRRQAVPSSSSHCVYNREWKKRSAQNRRPLNEQMSRSVRANYTVLLWKPCFAGLIVRHGFHGNNTYIIATAHFWGCIGNIGHNPLIHSLNCLPIYTVLCKYQAIFATEYLASCNYRCIFLPMALDNLPDFPSTNIKGW